MKDLVEYLFFELCTVIKKETVVRIVDVLLSVSPQNLLKLPMLEKTVYD